jgi:hypothetical protein
MSRSGRFRRCFKICQISSGVGFVPTHRRSETDRSCEKAAGIYHVDFAQYVRILTQDNYMETLEALLPTVATYQQVKGAASSVDQFSFCGFNRSDGEQRHYTSH